VTDATTGIPSNARVSFGLVVRRTVTGGLASGQFNYLDHSTLFHVNGPVTVLIIYPGTKRATLQGIATNGCLFVVDVEDVADPGRNKDTFDATITGVTLTGGACAEETGLNRPLTSGNIQFH
jgi:hypothetical protein